MARTLRCFVFPACGLLLCVLITACAGAHRVVDGSSTQRGDNGYVLISINSSMNGVLPLKPESFWGVPMFVELGKNRHYLLQMKSGDYTLGAIGVGMRVGWGTYNEAPFTVLPGKVVYLGEYHFALTGPNTYTWGVVDNLQNSLENIPEKAKQEISGLQIDDRTPKVARKE